MGATEKNVAQTNVKANNIGIGYGLKDMLAQIFVWGAQTLPPQMIPSKTFHTK